MSEQTTPVQPEGRGMRSRKFILAFFAVATATWLVYDGKINEGAYTSVVTLTLGLYLAANVYQRVNTQ